MIWHFFQRQWEYLHNPMYVIVLYFCFRRLKWFLIFTYPSLKILIFNRKCYQCIVYMRVDLNFFFF